LIFCPDFSKILNNYIGTILSILPASLYIVRLRDWFGFYRWNSNGEDQDWKSRVAEVPWVDSLTSPRQVPKRRASKDDIPAGYRNKILKRQRDPLHFNEKQSRFVSKKAE
jgi:hypothetical protein